MNPKIQLKFKDGASSTMYVPRFTVAYAIMDDDPKRIHILTVQKTPKDETGWDALARGKAKFPNLEFTTTSGIECGCVPTGSAHGYWRAEVRRLDDNRLQLMLNPKDPMLAAWGFITNQDAATGWVEDEEVIERWVKALLGEKEDPTKLSNLNSKMVTKPSM
jgi:hypothetical protein